MPGSRFNVVEFLADVSARGDKLSLAGEQLRFATRAPQPPAAVVETIRAHRSALIEWLQAKAAAPQVYPMSAGQQGLWMAWRLDPKTPIYNLYLVARLQPDVAPDRVQAVLQALAERHPVLRSRFRWPEGEAPRQQVDDGFRFALERVDGRGWSAAEVQAWSEREADRPFDLEHGPVMRAALLETRDARGATRRLLHWTLHHIVSDFLSQEVLIDDLEALIRAEGAADALDAPRLSYHDFVRWEEDSTPDRDAARRWWRAQIAGWPPAAELPADLAGSDGPYRSGTFEFDLDAELSAAVRAFAHAQRVSVFRVLLAAYQVVLARYTGRERFVVTTPTSLRHLSGWERTAGYMINPLCVAVDLSGAPSTLEVLARTQAQLAAAFEHQMFPFSEVLRLIQSAGADMPAFGFILDATREAARAPSLFAEVLAVGQRGAPEPVSLSMFDMGGDLGGAFTYDARRFLPDTMRRLAAALRVALHGMTADPARPVSQVSLLDATARETIVTDWSGQSAPAPAADHPMHTTLDALFARQVARTPDAVALTALDDAGGARASITYAELDRWSRVIAGRLRAHGAERGAVVGVYADRSIATVAALLGVHRAGAAYLPLDPSYPQARLEYMLADSGASLLITTAAMRAAAPAAAGVTIIEIGEAPDGAAPAAGDVPPATGPDDLAYVIYTSGSTGRPKGVEALHRATTNRLAWMWRAMPFEADEVCCHKTALSFVDSVWEIFGPLLQGVPSVIVSTRAVQDVPRFIEALAAHRVTRLVLVPSLLRAMLGDGAGVPLGTRLPALRQWVCSGESLPVELTRAFQAQCPAARLINLYGSSEVAADVTWYDASSLAPVGSQWPGAVPIGRPISHAWCYILDDAREPVPPGVEGELYVGGACLARGYRGRPEATAERFVANPFAPGRLFRTGDRARWLPSPVPGARPEIGFLGRADTQVKIRGFRVDLTEITAALVALPGVREAVVQRREEATGPKLVACVSTTRAMRPGALHAELSRLLPDYMVPGGFVILDRMPLTPNGKIDLQALAQMPCDSAAGAGAEPPATDTERTIAAIWSAVLGGAVADRHDNFFLLGGHSLLATQVATRLSEALKRPVPLRAVFDHPTLADLALWADGVRASTPDALPGPAPRAQPAEPPLSFAQERLWVLHRFETTLSAYTAPLALRLSGPLDRDALEAALQALAACHAALRTTFPERGGLPSQRVARSAKIPLTRVELTGASHPDEALGAAMRSAASEPFDLANGPLARATLFTLGEGEHALLLCLHHIIADGWSLGVLAQDLDAAYRAAVAGETPALPAAALDPVDYTLWQREAAETAVWKDWLAAWCRALDGAPTVLELPTDRPRPAVQETACAAVPVALDAELTRALERLAEAHGASLFMVVLALWATLLARHGGGDDIVIGAPVANRHHPGLERLVGCLVNTVPLRVVVPGEASFAELLDAVREATLGAYARQDVPVEQTLNALRLDRSLSHAPLFQSIVTVEYAQSHPAARSYALGELGARWIDLGRAHTEMDLSLELIRAEAGLAGWIDYATALFDGATVERLAARLRTLAQAAVSDATQTVAALPILPAAERAAVLALGAPAPLPGAGIPIQAMFERQVARTPEAIAVIEATPGMAPDACRVLTYAELNARANRLARRLMALRPAGLGPQPESLDRAALRPHLIGICLGRSAEMLVAMLGALKAGFGYVPVDSTWPPQRVAMILDDADPFAVITEAGLLDDAALAGRIVVEIERGPIDPAAPDAADPPAQSRPEDVAYVMYTSGSTGRPKGVVVEHRHVVNYTLGFVDRVGLDARDRALQHGTLAFDICIEEIIPPLSVGASVVVCVDPSGIEAIVDDAIRHRVTMVCTTPLLTRYFDSRADELCDLRFVASGGDVLHPEEVAALLARGIGVYNSFGPTETTVTATSHRVETASGALPIGTPLAHARAFVLDAHGEPLPPGVSGELYIGGGGVARGYLDRPELTAERFVVWAGADPSGERLYRTGDRARWRADGLLEFVGRMDRQVKIRGFRVELGEIEAVLLRHGAVEQVAVVADHDAQHQRRLVAYVVAPTAEQGALSPALRAHLRDHLPVYMIPSAFVVLERLPLTPTGKIDRKALPAPEESAAPPTLHRPRSATEQGILTIWRRVLGSEAIDIFDNFFELGGHSLLAVRLMAQIGEAYDTALPLQALFRYPTVAELAAHVDERTPERAWSTLVALQPRGERAPLFCVPGDGGNVFYFHPLARALGPDRPVYGLESLGLDGKAAPHPTVEAAAAWHIAQIKARWPRGPYHLAGHSFGGLVAFEMAQQLWRAGETVATLAVLDTLPPSMPLPRASEAELVVTFERLFAEEYGAEATLTVETMAPLSPEARLVSLTRALERIGALPMGAGTRHVRTIFEVFRLNTRTVYRPRDPVRLPFDLFLAAEAPETERAAMVAGWAELGAVRAQVVPGSHTTMTYAPHVSALAERLKACLGG
ncbi:MAG: amino acid adenylation domain-containing protein [Myxococcales bacterium]|nr:amino acid adenylation domain-containing protein [Myxococcales bacterium]